MSAIGIGEERVKLPRLRALRESKLLNQEELAEKAGISRGTILRLEAGYDARLPTVRKIAETLGVDPKELMGPESEATA
jgi:transcriptional regulator with XRE-family HTH domain